MSDWIRQLIRPSHDSGQWHAVKDKGYATRTMCGLSFEGPIETTRSVDRPDRDGRCQDCEARLMEKRSVAEPARAS